jgi:hypothetical protein
VTTHQFGQPPRSGLAQDDGAALVIALVITTVMALVVGAVLGLSGASVNATVATNSQARGTSAADAAAQVAINAVQNNTYNNDVASTTYPRCFGNTSSSDTMVVPYPGGGGSTFVSCAPDPGSGAGGGLVPITDKNKPGNAILTLGLVPVGIAVKALSGAPFNVHGSVVSNSDILVTNGTLQSSAGVYANLGCLGSITGNPKSCLLHLAADPNYPAEVSTVPAYQAVPSACPGKVVTFLPGYYDNAAALSGLMDGNGGCKGSVWWFTPGNYYFDFHDYLTGGLDVWTIKDGQLLAGRPVDAAGNVLSSPSQPITIPGACQNPIRTVNAQGVQFIFGGDSQLFMKSGDAEICGTYHTDRPPIAIYGVKAGDESPTGATVALNAVTAPADFGATATVANLKAVDNAFATWTNTGGGNQTGTMTLDGFPTPTAIPAGSVLTAATATVVYKNDGNLLQTTDQRTLTITPVGGTAILPALTLPNLPGLGVQTVTVPIVGAPSLATFVHDNGYSGARVTYSVTVNHKNTESVDSIRLNLAYTPPAFRAEGITLSQPANCLATLCSAISTATSYADSFYVEGTTYMPIASMDLTLNNITQQVMRFGVILRSLNVKETGSINYTGPVIEVPDNSPGLGFNSTVIFLTVYDCPGASTCSAGGRLRLRSRVLVFDPGGTPVAGNRTMNIQSWAVAR